MGFVLGSLGPADTAAVLQLSPEIIRTLRKASDSVRSGRATGESHKWFGDTSAAWMNGLAQQLNKLASLVNVQPIEVGFQTLGDRDGSEFASALRPKCGWKNMTTGSNFMTQAQGQGYRIFLNESWNRAPLYRPFKRPADSKFQTLVHECTHLFLNTDDDAYGVPTCELTASRQPAVAKKTADNWGYFVEEFR
jgi:hypothetical protein